MAIKKSELYGKIWKSCDELRGGMDASQYKDYVLILLFMRYVTDKYYNKKDALIDVPDGGSYKNLIDLKGNKEIGDKTNKVIKKLAETNDLDGIITVADFNDSTKLGNGKELVDRLTNLITIFEDEELNFSNNRADNDDILGDAYEYLMRHFATESGKSKGQFYTPSEVSRIMAKVISIEKATSKSQTIYDPTCGSGSLLLKAADEAQKGITLFGQEMDNATAALAKMNMILHGNETAQIHQDNTLSNPYWKDSNGKLKTYDFAVANPPFSTKSWKNGFDPENDLYDRFKGFGIPPDKNGDYAFLLHFISSLKSNGKGAIILPHGVLFRGNVEGEIRKNIIKKGYISGIIGLPPNLFYGTGIPACIIVIDKENSQVRKGIFMIDASKGFIKDGNKNRLREQDIHKIVDVFNKKIEISKYSKMVSTKEIENNEYNLNIPRYIDNQEEEDIQDIEAHLLGDIPNKDIDDLQKYWEVYPTLKNVLFAKNDREGYSKLNVAKDDIRNTIFNHQEFKSYKKDIGEIISEWENKHIPMLKAIDNKTNIKDLIIELSENILIAFSDKTLIDKYDIYQYLMTYWNETMKDDVYMIIENGWKADISYKKDKNGKTKTDEWDCELIPKHYVIDKYFEKEKKQIEKLEIERDEITRQKEEYEEENSGDESVLEELKNDKGQISKGKVEARIKEIKKDKDSKSELDVLSNYLELLDKETKANSLIKEEQKRLNNKVLNKYKDLTIDEIKELVVNDKWMNRIVNDVNSEMERVSQRLTTRIKELAQRYENPLPQIENEVDELEKKVKEHLKKMGFNE